MEKSSRLYVLSSRGEMSNRREMVRACRKDARDRMNRANEPCQGHRGEDNTGNETEPAGNWDTNRSGRLGGLHSGFHLLEEVND